MGDKKIHVEIVTPYELFYEGNVDQIVLPAIDGEIGILPGHAPVIVALNPGEIRMTDGDKILYISASDGYAQIEIDCAIIVIGSAEWPEQIDLDRANLAMARAEQRIHAPGVSQQEVLRGKRGILRAKARIKVAGRLDKEKKT